MSYRVFATGIGEVADVTCDWMPPSELLRSARIDAVLAGVPSGTRCHVRQCERDYEFRLHAVDFLNVGDLMAQNIIDWELIDAINPQDTMHVVAALAAATIE